MFGLTASKINFVGATALPRYVCSWLSRAFIYNLPFLIVKTRLSVCSWQACNSSIAAYPQPMTRAHIGNFQILCNHMLIKESCALQVQGTLAAYIVVVALIGHNEEWKEIQNRINSFFMAKKLFIFYKQKKNASTIFFINIKGCRKFVLIDQNHFH